METIYALVFEVRKDNPIQFISKRKHIKIITKR